MPAWQRTAGLRQYVARLPPLVYRPYLQTEGTDGEGSGGAEAVSNVIAELSLSRLMENDAMRLHITDASGDVTLVDIPLVEYLLMTGREQDGRIKSDQEYLGPAGFLYHHPLPER